MSSLDRAFRLYSGPVVLAVIGVVGVALVDPSPVAAPGFEQMLVPFKRMLFFGACGAAIVGALWGAWNVFLEYRWARGDLNGGCHNCGGPMRHKDGRWGAYSKCIMCGSKREGWH